MTDKGHYEGDIVRVLKVMLVVPRLTEDGCREGLAWTAQTIADYTRLAVARVESVVRTLTRRAYIYRDRGEYHVTDAGEMYYRTACRRPVCAPTAAAWKDEALTGIRMDGSRSAITNAALPTCSPDHGRQDPEREIARRELTAKLRRQLARDLNIGMTELDRRMLDGSIHMCPGHGREPHVGIFHKNGPSWRRLCRECRQRKRGEEGGR